MNVPSFQHDDNIDDIIKILKSLSSHERLALLHVIACKGEEGITPTDILQSISMSSSQLSFHLKLLMKANIIDARKKGRHIYYRVAFNHASWFIKTLANTVMPDEKVKLTISKKAQASIIL